MRRTMLICWITLTASLATGLALAQPPQNQDKPQRTPDIIYVPTAHEVVDKMLELADVRKGEVVDDLALADVGQFEHFVNNFVGGGDVNDVGGALRFVVVLGRLGEGKPRGQGGGQRDPTDEHCAAHGLFPLFLRGGGGLAARGRPKPRGPSSCRGPEIRRESQ